MAGWENTTYVHQASVARVTEALDLIFSGEGMKRVPAPPQRERLRVEPLQYDGALDNDLWGLAVFPGSDGWTIIKTAPLELLAESASSSPRSRLTKVAEVLATSALQVNVYDGLVVLYEVSADGKQAFSGFSGEVEWNGFTTTEENYLPRFQIHDLGNLLGQEEMSGDEFAAIVSEKLGGMNAAYCDNSVSVDTLISHKPFLATGGQAIYYRWSGTSRQRHVPSDSYDQWVEPGSREEQLIKRIDASDPGGSAQ